MQYISQFEVDDSMVKAMIGDELGANLSAKNKWMYNLFIMEIFQINVLRFK